LATYLGEPATLAANAIVIVKLIRPERIGLARKCRNLVLESSNKAGVTFPVARHHSQLIAQPGILSSFVGTRIRGEHDGD
jgi:hypothetical protein